MRTDRMTAAAPSDRANRQIRRLAYSPDEAAVSLGVSRDYLDEYIARELRWVRYGRDKLVSIKELESWLERSSARMLE